MKIIVKVIIIEKYNFKTMRILTFKKKKRRHLLSQVLVVAGGRLRNGTCPSCCPWVMLRGHFQLYSPPINMSVHGENLAGGQIQLLFMTNTQPITQAQWCGVLLDMTPGDLLYTSREHWQPHNMLERFFSWFCYLTSEPVFQHVNTHAHTAHVCSIFMASKITKFIHDRKPMGLLYTMWANCHQSAWNLTELWGTSTMLGVQLFRNLSWDACTTPYHTV